MTEITTVPIPTLEERRELLVHQLVQFAHQIADGDMDANCFILLAVDTNYHPPQVTYVEHDMSYGDAMWALEDAKRQLFDEAYEYE